MNNVCNAHKVAHCLCVFVNLCDAALFCFGFFLPPLMVPSEPLIFGMLILFSARAACSIIFLSLLTMTAAHLSPPSQQLLIFSSRLTEWRCQSQKGQTASPRRNASRKNTSSHRWDKLLGIHREVAPRWFCSMFYKVTRKNLPSD